VCGNGQSYQLSAYPFKEFHELIGLADLLPNDAQVN
jgi:hypothetical protein